VDGRIEISAPQELVFSCGGAFIRLKGGDIEIGAPGNIYHKAAVVQKSGATSLNAPVTPIPTGYAGTYTLKDDAQQPMPFTLYQITTQEGEVFKGVTDKEGKTVRVHTLLPGGLKIEFPRESIYDEQLLITGPEGQIAGNLKYSITLADGSVVDGETDEQGYTQRLVTQMPMQINRLTLFPPEGAEPLCCAAQNTQAPLELDLRASNIITNDGNVGSSSRVVALPKGHKRDLTSGEIDMAKTVFQNAVKYSKVKVHHGGWWLFMGFQNTAVTPNGEMYYPENTGFYRDDFSKTDSHKDKALFMHEMTHVWQFQLGYPVKKAGVTVTRRGADAYKYKLSPERAFAGYNMEQQGEIVSDYFIICIKNEPGSVWDLANRGKDPAALRRVVQKVLDNPHEKSNLPV
jgi:hypothetical protein